MNRFRPLLGFISAIVALSACSESPKEEKATGLYFEQSDTTGAAIQQEPEGPQYQSPTIEVLKGKPQLFPSKYPLKRYPGCKVAMVDVKAGRPPGWMNMVMLNSSDNPSNISEFYRKQLVNESWKKIYEYKNPIYESTKWVKGDLECEVRISPDLVGNSDKQNVQLFYGLHRKSQP